MNDNLTEIVVVLDRSGSMNDGRDDMEGGLNEFIKTQKECPGEAVLTLVQFDTEYEFVHKSKPIAAVGHVPLQPRGRTALLDALGRAIAEVKEAQGQLKDENKPAKTVVMVVTDGYENASREYTRQQVKKLVEEQTAAGWQFVYLGADVDAFAEAGAMGVAAAGTTNFNKTQMGIKAAYGATAQNVCMYRSGAKSDVAYSQDQRDAMNK